jgi:hypothetical protein
MKFIVPVHESRGWPPAITMCALCSEDPRFCCDDKF